jgi:hypothetical protein
LLQRRFACCNYKLSAREEHDNDHFTSSSHRSIQKRRLLAAQVNRNLPYGDINLMVAAARAEGANVTQVSADRFLVNNSAWVKAHGCVSPI